jgi:hypothetical protein
MMTSGVSNPSQYTISLDTTTRMRHTLQLFSGLSKGKNGRQKFSFEVVAS